MKDEHILLRSPRSEAVTFFAMVPEDATYHAVPDDPSVPADIRGLAFKRTGHIDPVTKLPTFRKRERQV